MDLHTKSDLERRIEMVCFQWYADNFGEFSAASNAEVTLMLEAANFMKQEADEVLRRWVDVARCAGQSWSEIGLTLETTKQWAQKRYAGEAAGRAAAMVEPDEYLRETTTVNEMLILDREGQRGGEALDRVSGCWRFRRTDKAWSYTRRLQPADQRETSCPHDTEHFAAVWPFQYFKASSLG